MVNIYLLLMMVVVTVAVAARMTQSFARADSDGATPQATACGSRAAIHSCILNSYPVFNDNSCEWTGKHVNVTSNCDLRAFTPAEARSLLNNTAVRRQCKFFFMQLHQHSVVP